MDARPRWASGVIAVALAAMVAIPARYYLGAHDPFEERFAWRMFSTVRSYACEAEARETAPGAPEAGPVVVVLHPGWLERIRRNRRSVIDAYLRHRCAHAELAGATVTTTCVGYDTDWVSRHAITCETGTIAFEREEMPR